VVSIGRHNAAHKPTEKQTMTTNLDISFRRFEKCPISGKTREIVGIIPAFFSSYSGAHHFPAFVEGDLPKGILSDLDNGRTMGSAQHNGATIVWSTLAH
jgi:hypothetical protein